MDAPTYVIVDGRKDGRTDKGKSKCPLKWGHKNHYYYITLLQCSK